MADRHGDTKVQRAFTAQAHAFEDPRFNRVIAQDVGWMFADIQLDPDHMVLDVAAGTGQVARALARHVRAVLAFDMTQAMLDQGKLAADNENVDNVVFLRGDAAHLPFADATFDVVTCRYALHHFGDPSIYLGEMARCLRPGGQLALADLIAAESPEIAARQDALERLRDPSHGSLLSASGMRDAVERTGAACVGEAAKETHRPLGPWLRQTATPEVDAERIIAALSAEIDGGGEATGFQPARDDRGELTFVQSFASVVGRKP